MSILQVGFLTHLNIVRKTIGPLVNRADEDKITWLPTNVRDGGNGFVYCINRQDN